MFEYTEAARKKKNNTTRSACQKKTGIPAETKERFEYISGLSLEDVRVHYHSDKPSKLGALAYTQENSIYIASGQEMHLGHELGHIIQQKQGRIRPTEYLEGVPVNSDPSLEREADVLSSKARSAQLRTKKTLREETGGAKSIQFLLNRIKSGEKSATQQVMPESFRSTTVLSAVLDGKDLGLFKSQGGKHAEDALMLYLQDKKITGGMLKIYINTSPCSSTYSTSKKTTGCQEELEALGGEFEIEVVADHPYQPKGVEGAKAKSMKAAEKSTIKIGFEKGVAQLKRIGALFV